MRLSYGGEEISNTETQKEGLSGLSQTVLLFIASCRQYLFLRQQQIEPDHNNRRRHIHRLLAETIVDTIDQDCAHEGEVERSDSSIPPTFFRQGKRGLSQGQYGRKGCQSFHFKLLLDEVEPDNGDAL